MSRCQLTKKTHVKEKGVLVSKMMPVCGLEAQKDSAYCPRHTFLANMAEQATAAKEANQSDAKAAGVRGIGPRTRAGMIAAGYLYTGNGECRGCGKQIEWWQTPLGRKAPYNPMAHEDAFAQSHFATCTRASAFVQQKRSA